MQYLRKKLAQSRLGGEINKIIKYFNGEQTLSLKKLSLPKPTPKLNWLAYKNNLRYLFVVFKNVNINKF